MVCITLGRSTRNFIGQCRIDCSICEQIIVFLFIVNVNWQISKLGAFFMGHPVYILCIMYTYVYVTVHMETHAVCKRPSPFVNSLKGEPVCKRTRQYENREDARLRKYESRKTTWLRASVECEKSLWGVHSCRYGRTFFAG